MKVKTIFKISPLLFASLILSNQASAMMKCNDKAVMLPLWQALHNTKLDYSDFHVGNMVVMYHNRKVCTAHFKWQHCPKNNLHVVIPIANAINVTQIAAFRGYTTSSPEPEGKCWGTVYYNFNQS